MKDKINETKEALKKKIEDADLEKKGKAFFGEVKAGFHASEEEVGVKAIISRFKNLWLSGWQGKIAEIAAVFLVILLVSGGGNDSTPSGKSHKTSKKPKKEKTLDPTMSHSDMDINGYKLGMTFEECQKKMKEEYGEDVIGFGKRYGEKRKTHCLVEAKSDNVLFNYVDHSGKSGYSAIERNNNYRTAFVELPCVAGGSFKPRHYSSDKEYETGTMCMFANSATGLTVCGIYRKTNIPDATMRSSIKEKVIAKNGDPDGMQSGILVWMLKPYSSNFLEACVTMPISGISTACHRAWNEDNGAVKFFFGKDYLTEESWLVYNIGGGEITKTIEACCMDFDMIVSSSRFNYNQRVLKNEKDKAEELEKAKNNVSDVSF